MAEPKRARDPHVDLRNSIRHKVKSGTKVDIDVVSGKMEAELLDFSPEGCAIVCDQEVDPSVSEVLIHFSTPATISRTPEARLTRIHSRSVMSDGRMRLGLQFDDALPQDIFTRFNSVLQGPLSDQMTRRKHFEAQRTLALGDIENLRTSNRDLRTRQLQILLMALPIFIGLLGASYAFILDPSRATSSGSAPMWVLFLPLSCLLLSVPMYAVFLQKKATMARQGAFSLLLERCIANASFPSGYRGWTDASSHLDHTSRFGLKSDSPLHVRPVPRLPLPSRTAFSGDAFLCMAAMVFLGVPALSILAVWMLAMKLGLGWTWYTIVVMLTTIGLVVSYIWGGRYSRRIDHGELSFDFMLLRLDKIITHLQAYDPYSHEAY